MAAPVCQFVDRVGTGAVQRLNLNDGENFRLLHGPDFRPGPDFSPPALKRAVVNTLMAEGASIPASAYDNRVIRLPLRLKACDEAEMGTMLESLHRELDRGNNILKWHPTYNTRPVYFRTFRSPDYRMDQGLEPRELRTTLALVAEPFAYGDYVQQTGTVYNDPAAVANGTHFEITATEGDVPTPLFLYCSTSFAGEILLATRRHGTPALYFEQAESMVQGVDTAVAGAPDPLMSGAGNNYSRTTFATTPGMSVRLSWNTVPGAGDDDDYRGLYRVFVRVRRSNNTDDINIRMDVADAVAKTGYYSDSVVVPKSTSIQLVDLGLVAIPTGPDPIYGGYSGVVLPTECILIRFQAEREAGGTGNLDWDYAVLVPADEELVLTNPAIAIKVLFDGPNDIIFPGDLTKVVVDGNVPQIGAIPLVTPDQTNLYIMLLGISSNLIATTMAFTARYWPRYLYIQ